MLLHFGYNVSSEEIGKDLIKAYLLRHTFSMHYTGHI